MLPLRWIRNHLLAAAVVALLATAVATTSAFGLLSWVAVTLATAGTGSGAATLGSLLPAFVLGVLVGGPLAVIAAMGVGYVLVTRAVIALRLGIARRLSELAERHPIADAFLGVSDYAERYDPRTPMERAEDRIAWHKRRYVAGDFGESEFERRVRRILDDEGVYRDMATEAVPVSPTAGLSRTDAHSTTNPGPDAHRRSREIEIE